MPSEPVLEQSLRRTYPVFWLLVPWGLLLSALARAVLDAVPSPPEARGVAATLDRLLTGGFLAAVPAMLLLPLALTWVWLAIAVPRMQRRGCWLALGAIVATLGVSAETPSAVGALLLVVGCGVSWAVASASFRARARRRAFATAALAPLSHPGHLQA